jgi:hypothetical protein
VGREIINKRNAMRGHAAGAVSVSIPICSSCPDRCAAAAPCRTSPVVGVAAAAAKDNKAKRYVIFNFTSGFAFWAGFRRRDCSSSLLRQRCQGALQGIDQHFLVRIQLSNAIEFLRDGQRLLVAGLRIVACLPEPIQA